MEFLDKNILDSIVFGFVKNILDTRRHNLDCNKDKIQKSYNTAIFYIQYDYLINPNIVCLSIIKILNDIIDNELFLDRIRMFIEMNYDCYVDEKTFQEIIQQVISEIKSEIQSTKKL